MNFKHILAAALVLAPGGVFAQEIAVKSIPVATGSQFLLYPSEYASMGGGGIALEDALGDPYDNPAKGVNIRRNYFASTPQYYSIGATSNSQGHGTRTLPVGALVRNGRYFGGFTLAWQEMLRRQFTEPGRFMMGSNGRASVLTVRAWPEWSATNLYLSITGGAELRSGLSAGFSAFRANLNGLGGVQLLYLQGDNVDQDGSMNTYKLGLYQKWPDGRTAEVVAQHHRFQMTHAMIPAELPPQFAARERLEKDETNGVAVRLGYTQPMSRGWTVGARLVGDWKTHPKIPNYDLMQIPRDPGNTSAYNVGIGFSRVLEETTFGFDLIYEPIWSHTWANAEEDIIINDEPTGIKAGDMTVENYFLFHNSLMRIGVHRGGRLNFGLGLNLHLFRYRLEQENFVQRSKRALEEAWGEWTWTAGLGYKFTGFSLQYLSIMTHGTGQPGLAQSRVGNARNFLGASTSFILAPASALDLIDARVWTHRLSLLIPLPE